VDISLRYAARSDVGLVRANNQDSGYAGPHLLVVADGMGGHAGGDVASSVTIAALAPLDEEAHGADDALDVLSTALATAKAEIVARIEKDPELAGMGTTVTAILRSGNKLSMVHLGDSRCYVLREDELTQVTTDHTFVQHLVDTGKITPEEAEHHPQRSVVMRVLGDFDLALSPDLSVREARLGDRYMLCSDGLSGFVSMDTIAETMQTTDDPGECAEQLLQLALRAGGGDNVTVIVADIVDSDALPDGQQPSVEPQVVGAAAMSRHSPTTAADGPAARAGALVSGARPEIDLDEDEDEDVPRRRGGLVAVWLGAFVVVALLLTGAYWWTQTQYYVGESDGYVAIYQGIPASVGPLRLSHVVERPDPPLLMDCPLSQQSTVCLTQQQRPRVEDTMSADSLGEARDIVQRLREQATAESDRPTTTPPTTPPPTISSDPPVESDPPAEPDPLVESDQPPDDPPADGP
jgi:protein phosphatase